MKTFFSNLEVRTRKIDSLLCVGLDPAPEDLPAANADAAREFCLRLIEATADLAAAFKPNAAFFEALGTPGWQALADVIHAVPRDTPVILDGKRGDIASTAEAYARSAFEVLGAGAITLSPYLGRDALEPFLKHPEHGVFLLCRTSNPGASDLQDLLVKDLAAPPQAEGTPLYEKVASLAQLWNTRGNLGLVAGATYPEALARVRAAAPDLWILAPGVGAQGGELKAALRAGLRSDGSGLLLPVSRGISRSADPRGAARELVEAMRREREAIMAGQPAAHAPSISRRLAEGLLRAGCVRFGQFTLKSGLQSPIYLDLRQLTGHPALLAEAARAYLPILRGLHFDRLAAIPFAGLPIATAIGLAGGWPLIYPRREAKEYGMRAEIEGPFHPGDRVVVIDDLATTGGSKFEVIARLEAAGLLVKDVAVLIDRQSGAREALAASGYRLHAVVTLAQLLDQWEALGLVSAGELAAARAFLADQGDSG
jgi:uridine monophosphate synthetase